MLIAHHHLPPPQVIMDDYDYDFRASIRSEIDQLCAGGIQLFNNFCEEIRSEIFGPVASFDRMRLRTAMEWDSFDRSAETFDDTDVNNNYNQKERKIHQP